MIWLKGPSQWSQITLLINVAQGRVSCYFTEAWTYIFRAFDATDFGERLLGTYYCI